MNLRNSNLYCVGIFALIFILQGILWYLDRRAQKKGNGDQEKFRGDHM